MNNPALSLGLWAHLLHPIHAHTLLGLVPSEEHFMSQRSLKSVKRCRREDSQGALEHTHAVDWTYLTAPLKGKHGRELGDSIL